MTNHILSHLHPGTRAKLESHVVCIVMHLLSFVPLLPQWTFMESTYLQHLKTKTIFFHCVAPAFLKIILLIKPIFIQFFQQQTRGRESKILNLFLNIECYYSNANCELKNVCSNSDKAPISWHIWHHNCLQWLWSHNRPFKYVFICWLKKIKCKNFCREK